MGSTAAQFTTQTPPAAGSKISAGRSLWRIIVLQVCVGASVAAALWQLLGAEPQTLWDCRLKWGLPGLVYLLTLACWFLGSHPPRWIEMLGIGGFSLAMLLIGLTTEQEFNASDRILVPARLKDGRIVHESLGLSYTMLPQFRVNPQPMVTRRSEAKGNNSQIQSARLGFGEMAILIRIVVNPSSPGTSGSPSTIILEAQRDSLRDLNSLVIGVRQNEARWKELPNIRIVQPTHRLRRADLEMVEFDFVEEPQNLLSRQVFMRSGSFILNFMLNSEHDADRPIFEEFLNSIRVAPAN